MNRLRVFIVLTVLLSGAVLPLAGCNKKASSYNPDFVGKWYTVPAYDSTYSAILRSEIVIEKRDGLYNYNCKDTCGAHLCDCISQQAGRAVVSLEKDRLRIGSTGSYSLTIDKEPYQDASGQWTMIIDGLTFYREQ